MKKILLMMTAALLVVSCENGPDEPKGPKYPEPEKGATYQLEGTVNTEGFAWTSSAVVGLYSQMTEVRASNLACRIVGYVDPSAEAEEDAAPEQSPYEGKAVARFNTPAMDLVKGENTFLVYTPYNPELLYLAGMIYGLSVGEEQTQSAPNVAGDCFAIGTASGIAGVDEAFNFELTPITALAKFTISSSEFAGYAPKKITVYDESGEAELAGAFNVAVENLSFQTLETYKRASITVKNPVALTASSKQNIYLNLLPNDFTGKDLWIIVEFEGEKGHVTIPMKKSGLVFAAGQTTEIDLSNISSNDNAAKDWYEPVESRYLAGPGVAYGDANTYFIQCKNGQTYKGADYSPDSSIPDEIKIDIKARGNFFNCVDPRGATFEWYTTANGSTYLPRTANYEASGVDPKQFTISYDGNTTVTVKNTGAFAGAPILLMKKDGKVLWAWAFWNVAADGTRVEAVNIGTYQLANMDIGQPTTQFEKWIANKDTGGNPDVAFRMHHLYQWGRPIPVFWTTYWTTDDLASGTVGNCPVLWGPLSLEEALANPVGVIVGKPVDGADNTITQWQTDTVGDLWGNLNQDTAATGTKSIYDPCPKGWRVPDRALFDYLVTTTPGNAQGYTYEDTPGMVGIRINGNLLLAQGYINGKVDPSNGRYATMGGGASGSAANCSHGLIWSNYLGAATASQPATLYYRSSSGAAAPRVAGYNRTMAASVRCQKDNDNR